MAVQNFRNFYPINEICKNEDCGAGELVINHIDNEGTRKGFDVNLMEDLNEKVSIPLVALGGCGSKSIYPTYSKKRQYPEYHVVPFLYMRQKLRKFC